VASGADLCLACSERLDVPADESYVVGDAIWDLLAARRTRMLSVGLLSGGDGEEELIGVVLSAEGCERRPRL
jgi:phosphoglycolate phosphatase-like HAD superfamily hydrolase